MTAPRRRTVLAAAAAYAAISAAALFTPLLRDIGYEYALLLSFTGSAVAWLTTAALWGDPRRQEAAGVIDPGRTAGAALLVNGSALAVPLAVPGLAALGGRTCSVADSILFFLLLPVVSVWFSTALTIFCCVVFRRALRMVLAVAAVSFGYVLALGYFTPALHSFNFFYGYFPGVTYDELLEIPAALVLFRLYTVLLGGGLLWMALLLARHSRHTLTTSDRIRRLLELLTERRRLPLTGALALIILGATAFREQLGFETSSGFLASRLGDTTETEHFILHHPPGLAATGEIRRIAEEHEFFYSELTRTLPSTPGAKITSFLHPSSSARRSYIGADRTNIAKPWRREIHLTVGTVDEVLEHELVHVLAAPQGVPVLGISMSIGLTEGLAVAMEKTWGSRSLHRTAAAVRREGIAPDIRGTLSLAGFVTAPSSLSYLLAGSFTGYLQSTYGTERLLEVYRSLDYDGTYGKGPEELVSDWERFLEGQETDAGDRAAVRALFLRRAIFRKHCPRAVARGNTEAAGLYREGRYEAAAELYGRLYRESGGGESLGGFLASCFRAGRYTEIAAFYDSASAEARDRHLTLGVLLGDALWALGRREDARALYARVRMADIARAHTEAASVRLYALDDRRLGVPVLQYILSFRSDSAALPGLDSLIGEIQDDPLPLFLAGRHLLRSKRYREAHEAFAWAGEIARDSVLEYERLLGGGQALALSGRRREAAEVFRRAFLFARNDGNRRETYLWTRRCDTGLP